MLRAFILVRDEDASGQSGTGIVAEGVELASGRVVMEWLPSPHSIGLYESMHDLIGVHGHEGKTRIQWVQWTHGNTGATMGAAKG